MSQNSMDQKYPDDRFDEVEPYTTQQGAHRKEFAPPKGAGHLNTIIVAGGIALAIGAGSFLWLLPSDPLNQAGSASESTSREMVEDEPQDEEETDEPEAIEEPEPTDGQETIDLEDSQGPETEDSEQAESDESESDEPIDHELPIAVYNASSVQGYAASIAQDLGDAGFNVPVADNWTGTTPSTSTVYFSDNEPTAQAVAQQLDAATVYEPSIDGIVVVLTGDS